MIFFFGSKNSNGTKSDQNRCKLIAENDLIENIQKFDKPLEKLGLFTETF